MNIVYEQEYDEAKFVNSCLGQLADLQAAMGRRATTLKKLIPPYESSAQQVIAALLRIDLATRAKAMLQTFGKLSTVREVVVQYDLLDDVVARVASSREPGQLGFEDTHCAVFVYLRVARSKPRYHLQLGFVGQDFAQQAYQVKAYLVKRPDDTVNI